MEKLTTLQQVKKAILRTASDATKRAAEVAETSINAIDEIERSKQDKALCSTVTLPASGWKNGTQTAGVAGVTANEATQLILPTPTLASQNAYYKAGILCTGQAADSLTFTADTTPTEDLTVYVVIQEVAV